jgi:hypothetical protein
MIKAVTVLAILPPRQYSYPLGATGRILGEHDVGSKKYLSVEMDQDKEAWFFILDEEVERVH